jgi:hypothetical protein
MCEFIRKVFNPEGTAEPERREKMNMQQHVSQVNVL